MLLYALLYLTGYDLTLDDLKAFRQWGSKTPGHPERLHTPGVEMTTGPLGQGISHAVGMAIAEAHMAARFNKPDAPVFDHFTYAMVSDGDLMEGVTAEACALAGHLGLGRLIVLYDDNGISLAGATELSFTEDMTGRFKASGWQVITVSDGNDVAEIDAAISAAKATTDATFSDPCPDVHRLLAPPTKAGSAACHGSPPGTKRACRCQRMPVLARRTGILCSGSGPVLFPPGPAKRQSCPKSMAGDTCPVH